MECKETRETFSYYIDGRLSGPDRNRFEHHIAGCAECRALFEETRQALSSIKGTVPPPLPPDFLARLNERLDKEGARAEKRAAWLFPWKPLAAVLSVVLVVVIAKETLRPPDVMLQGLKSAAPASEGQLAEREKAVKTVSADKEIPGAVVGQKASSAIDEQPALQEQTRQSKQEFAAESREKDTLAPAQALTKYDAQAPSGAGFMSKARTSAIAAESFSAPRILPVQNQWKGYSSGVTSPQRITVKNQREWESLWQRHDAGAPAVDFNHYMAIAVFMGEKASGGYAVTISRVVLAERTVTVYYREESPSRDSTTSAVLTQPYHIIIVERSSLPVVFQSEQ